MHRTLPSARTPSRWTWRFLVVTALLAAIAAIAAIAAVAAITAGLGRQTRSASNSADPPPAAAPSSQPSSAASPHASHGGRGGAPDAADGVVPDGVTVFDDTVPAVARLDPDLLEAVRRAATAARGDGTVFYVNSGWRSPDYQNQLLREAVAKYGSEDEAARWVATAVASPHVSGDAVDLGRSDATAWLSEHGAAYGLCQIYRNEPWHYELRTDASDDGCPAKYADPTEDPRMRQ
ncbi:M15 family metallopeptidase [Streptomyces kunmingensis]|uniref:M15 family metallopeptidase n=1 Tax=Streptomyces kunmingensis TaxID=68225 RepID=A0ABU6C2F5_9ACTN|nr:M15 family metallopeptidase [Streptomyces kunmingensis]MEB3958893.1 M15 family metallopeptidase [Streptomyces kunmingensis]